VHDVSAFGAAETVSLREDGVIWISMDESEIAHLRCLMDEVFGRQRHLASLA
jgi:adenine-specific DNA-methyltransferase